jgi:hypothetical protein
MNPTCYRYNIPLLVVMFSMTVFCNTYPARDLSLVSVTLRELRRLLGNLYSGILGRSLLRNI